MTKFNRGKLGLIILGIVFLLFAYKQYQTGVVTKRQVEVHKSENRIWFSVEISLTSCLGIVLIGFGLFGKVKNKDD